MQVIDYILYANVCMEEKIEDEVIHRKQMKAFDNTEEVPFIHEFCTCQIHTYVS